jgi:hypothetical protein
VTSKFSPLPTLKLLLVFVALLLPWTSLLAEPVATLWTGKCVNKTLDTRGQVKLILFEPGKPDAKGVKRVSGYMSVSGWQNGGGEFEGTISDEELTFSTKHLTPMQWTGRFSRGGIIGSFSVPARGKDPVEIGEFYADKVSRGGGADQFRQNLMFVIESDYNGIVKGEDGKEYFTPQVIFDAVHPVGSGISVQITDLELEWQEGADRETLDGLRRYTMSFVLYWMSPLNGKGFTRLRTVHNAELGEMISCDLIETNGTTTDQVKQTSKDLGIKIGVAVGAAMLKSWLESK